MKPAHSIHTHWQVVQSLPASQNLPKSLAAPTHRRKGKIKHEHAISCIVHLADSAKVKGVTSKILCSGSTGSCFELPNDTIHVTVVGY